MSAIYMDHAAATPVDPGVAAAMQPFFIDNFYNPSATYLAAKAVRAAVEDARARIAKVLTVRPGEIVFTAGCTEANNLAIQGVMRQYPEANLLVSAIEHDSVLAPAGLYDHKIIPVDRFGHVDLSKLKQLINDKTVLVSIMLANNEIGTVQHLQQIGKLIAGVRLERQNLGNKLPLYLHSDAAQALNYLPLQPKRLGADLLSLNGGKIYGPKQSGLLFVASGIKLSPLIYGGGQEQGLRSGTENVVAIVGLAAAIEQTTQLRPAEAKRLAELQEYFIAELARQVPTAVITAPTDYRLPNIVHLTIPGHDNELLMMKMDEQGILCAVGSACSASNDEPSHVLKALGLSDKQAQTSLRFSMGRGTTKAAVAKTVKMLRKLL